MRDHRSVSDRARAALRFLVSCLAIAGVAAAGGAVILLVATAAFVASPLLAVAAFALLFRRGERVRGPPGPPATSAPRPPAPVRLAVRAHPPHPPRPEWAAAA